MRRLCIGWIFALAIGLATFMAACQQQPQEPQAPPDTRAADEASLRNFGYAVVEGSWRERRSAIRVVLR